jgi:hypothetical protein
VAVAPSDRPCIAAGAGTITLAIKTVEMDDEQAPRVVSPRAIEDRAKQRPNGSAFEAYVNGDVPALVHLGTVPNKRDPLAFLQRAKSLADDPTEVDEENLAVGC